MHTKLINTIYIMQYQNLKTQKSTKNYFLKIYLKNPKS